MRRKTAIAGVAVITALVVIGIAVTYRLVVNRRPPSPPTLSSARMPDVDAEQINAQLSGSDAAARGRAMRLLHEKFEQAPETVALHLALKWRTPLMRNKNYREVADWSLRASCVNLEWPISQGAMEFLTEARVRALLKLGDTRAALSGAKSYLNFVRIARAPAAQALMMECLASQPNGAALAKRFREEAMLTSGGPGSRASVLATIQVDAKPYEEAAMRVNTVEAEVRGGFLFRRLMHKGGLLLLADKPGEARSYFQEGLKLSKEMYLRDDPTMRLEAVEGLARCLCAEDGNPVRARRFLASPEAPEWAAAGRRPAGRLAAENEPARR